MLKKSLILNALAFLNIAMASASTMDALSSVDQTPLLGCGQVQTLVVDGKVTDEYGNTWRKVSQPLVLNTDRSFVGYYPDVNRIDLILAGGGLGMLGSNGHWFFEADIAKSGFMEDPIYFGKVIRVEAVREGN